MRTSAVTISKREARRRNQAGTTLVEILAVVALAAMFMLAALNYSIGWRGREEVRSGIYTLQTYLHLAQMQAVTRGRSCRFLVNTASRNLQVIDLNDPANATDDITIATTTLPSQITFSNPTGGAAATLEFQSGTWYRATFGADGSVAAGAGSVFIAGGDRFDRVTVYGAGGTRVERWSGAAWQVGS